MRHKQPQARTHRHRAFTMVELLAVVAIIGVMVGLLLPAVQSAREAARRRSCSNNFMQIGVAVQSYHHSFNQFPIHMSGTDGSPVVGQDNDRRLSMLVGILPFIEQSMITELIAKQQEPIGGEMGMGMDMYDEFEENFPEYESEDSSESETEDDTIFFPVGGPEPFERSYLAWMIEVPTYRCPSDPGTGNPSMGRTNYAASLGDGLVAINSGPMKSVNGRFVIDPALQAHTKASMRGVFVPRMRTRLKDVVDGSSHTIMMAEICTDLGDRDTRTEATVGPGEDVLRDNPNWVYQNDLIDPERREFWRNAAMSTQKGMSSVGRGHRWADGAPLFTGVNTIHPPNRPMVASTAKEDSSGYFPASSRHQGGAHVLFADGTVQFVTDSIDAGDLDAPTPYDGSPTTERKSRYGIWGAMGTRASEELVLVGEANVK